MKYERVYIGNIRKTITYNAVSMSELLCTIFNESVLVKKNAVLIKLKNGGYVDLDNLHNFLDLISIRKQMNQKRVEGIILYTEQYKQGMLFVDEDSLEPLTVEKTKHLSIGKLKKANF